MKYLLNLQNFIAEKLPEDGTLYEVCFVIYFIAMLISAFCWFWKIQNKSENNYT